MSEFGWLGLYIWYIDEGTLLKGIDPGRNGGLNSWPEFEVS
jgi:hypothetical protein